MSYLVDTDICSAHLRQQGPVTNRFLQYAGRIHLSVIRMGELLTWALRENAPPQRLQGVEDLISDAVILEVTEDVSRRFGELRAQLFDVGRPMPDMDLLIASTALVHQLTLVTHNLQDFVDVPGLNVADWFTP